MPDRMVYNQTNCWKGLQNGDPDALGFLYDTYADKLFDAALWVTGNRELIKDSLQDVFIEIWNYRSSIASVTNTQSYLIKVLHHIIFKKLKAISPPLINAEEIVYNAQNAEEMLVADDMAREQASRLKNACRQLTDRQQTVIHLRYYEGLSYKQIAVRLRMNYQSVNNLVFRTLTNLKKEFQS